MDTPVFCMLMHLSQLTNSILPGLGFVLPVIMWATNKDNVTVDRHGINIINWLISVFIYYLVCYGLFILGIGFFLLVILVICHSIFILIGAIKAYQGQIWAYPLSIGFIKSN